jgi:transcriptional regulator with XRE-family HTH domain
MPTTHLDEIRKKRPLARDARAAVDVLKRLMELEVSLTQLREARGVTQTSIAEQLATSRPNVSRIERESDLRVSTLSRYIEALGGQMEVRAVFPDAEVTLISAGALSREAKRSSPRNAASARKPTEESSSRRPTSRRGSRARA